MDDGDWYRTWGFAINKENAVHEKYNQNTIHVNLNCTEEYPGCLYCSTAGLV